MDTNRINIIKNAKNWFYWLPLSSHKPRFVIDSENGLLHLSRSRTGYRLRHPLTGKNGQRPVITGKFTHPPTGDFNGTAATRIMCCEPWAQIAGSADGRTLTAVGGYRPFGILETPGKPGAKR